MWELQKQFLKKSLYVRYLDSLDVHLLPLCVVFLMRVYTHISPGSG